MNGVQQQERRTAVSDLNRRLDDMGTVIEAVDTRIAKTAELTIDGLAEERAYADGRVLDLRASTDAELKKHHELLVVLFGRTSILTRSSFWERLWWLICG